MLLRKLGCRAKTYSSLSRNCFHKTLVNQFTFDGQVFGFADFDGLFEYVLSEEKVRASFLQTFIPDLKIKSSFRINDQLSNSKLHNNSTLPKITNLTTDQTNLIKTLQNEYNKLDYTLSVPSETYQTMDFVCQLENNEHILVEIHISSNSGYECVLWVSIKKRATSTTVAPKNKNNPTDKTAAEGFPTIENIPLIFEDKALSWCMKYNVKLVDTPGLNESNLSQETFHSFLKSKTFESIKQSVKSANVVLYLVEPSRIDDKSTVFLFSALSQSNTNIMIVLTKADEITRDVNQSVEQESERVIDFAEIQDQVKKLQDTFNCPVVAVSKNISNTEMDEQLSKLKIEKAIEIACKYSNSKKRVPLRAYNQSYEELKKQIKIGGVVGGVFSALGVTAIVGGALILAIPVIGTRGGAAAITSGLAFLGAGNGMLAGIGVLGGIALTTGATSAVLVTSSTAIASRLVASTLALDILKEETVLLPSLELDKQLKAEIEKYLKKALDQKFDTGINARYMSKEYNANELYYDAVFVQKDEELYCIQGCFEKRELIYSKYSKSCICGTNTHSLM